MLSFSVNSFLSKDYPPATFFPIYTTTIPVSCPLRELLCEEHPSLLCGKVGLYDMGQEATVLNGCSKTIHFSCACLFLYASKLVSPDGGCLFSLQDEKKGETYPTSVATF